MPIPMPANAVLDRYFLEMRCKVLDLAAAYDRIEQANPFSRDPKGSALLPTTPNTDDRLTKLTQALATLTDGQPDRAKRVQMIFSDKYETTWQRPNVRSK